MQACIGRFCGCGTRSSQAQTLLRLVAEKYGYLEKGQRAGAKGRELWRTGAHDLKEGAICNMGMMA